MRYISSSSELKARHKDTDMDSRAQLLCCILALPCVFLAVASAQGTTGTMLVYVPSNYNPSTYKACPNSGWNPSVAIPNGQAIFSGSQSSCGVTYNLTAEYSRGAGVKLVVKVVATCSGCSDNFQVSNSDFQSIIQRGVPPGSNTVIQFIKA